MTDQMAAKLANHGFVRNYTVVIGQGINRRRYRLAWALPKHKTYINATDRFGTVRGRDLQQAGWTCLGSLSQF